MPPTDAYWGLFWSDGSGGWVYSSEGVDALSIPDGGSVAFAWQDGGARDQPGVAPPQHASEQPSPSPSPDGDDDGGGNGDQGHGPGPASPSSTTSSAAPTGSASASPAPDQTEQARGDTGDKGDRKKRRDRGGKAGDAGQEAEGSPSPEADPSDAVPKASEPPAGSGDGGLPAWVAPVGIAALFGVAGAVALLRRRSTVR
jgi:hypothetical protein